VEEELEGTNTMGARNRRVLTVHIVKRQMHELQRAGSNIPVNQNNPTSKIPKI